MLALFRGDGYVASRILLQGAVRGKYLQSLDQVESRVFDII